MALSRRGGKAAGGETSLNLLVFTPIKPARNSIKDSSKNLCRSRIYPLAKQGILKI